MEPYCIKIGSVKLSSNRLRRFSRRIRNERGNVCERCGRACGAAHLHHFMEKYIYPMFAFEPDNVVVLCPRCHSWANSIQKLPDKYSWDFYTGFHKTTLDRLEGFRHRALEALAQGTPGRPITPPKPVIPKAPVPPAIGQLDFAFHSEVANKTEL